MASSTHRHVDIDWLVIELLLQRWLALLLLFVFAHFGKVPDVHALAERDALQTTETKTHNMYLAHVQCYTLGETRALA